MKAKTAISILLAFILLGSVAAFQAVVAKPVTFFELGQDPKATMRKYAAYLEDNTITHEPRHRTYYREGDIVGLLTVPAISMYERPIYYGANSVNNNWQITTSGYSGGWDMFGEPGVANIGAHNYQLFSNLALIQPGDIVIVETEYDIYVYKVTGTEIYRHGVDDWNKTAYASRPSGSVVLMTCWPADAADTEDKYLVYTTLVRGTLFDS